MTLTLELSEEQPWRRRPQPKGFPLRRGLRSLPNHTPRQPPGPAYFGNHSREYESRSRRNHGKHADGRSQSARPLHLRLAEARLPRGVSRAKQA